MASFSKKPLATAFSAALLASAVAPAMADGNPFAATQLSSGYDLANYSSDADKAGSSEARCGAEKSTKEGKCGEAKCGAEKAAKEGKCGEAKCGAEKAAKEGKCGEAKCGAEKSAHEGKCGEAKCGAN